MRIKKCRRCKTSIPRNARICPYCFKKQWTSTVIILLSIVVFLIGIGSYLKYFNKSTIDENLFLEGTTGEENESIDDNRAAEEESDIVMEKDKVLEREHTETKLPGEQQREKQPQEGTDIRTELQKQTEVEREREERERLEKERKEKERMRREQRAREQEEQERVRREIEAREKALEEKVEQERLRGEKSAPVAEEEAPVVTEDINPEEGSDMRESIPATVEDAQGADDTIKVDQGEPAVKDQ